MRLFWLELLFILGFVDLRTLIEKERAHARHH